MSTGQSLYSSIKKGLSNEKENDIEFETQMLAFAFLKEIENLSDSNNINRKELAEKVGTSASYLTQLFRGHKIPNLKILVSLGLVFDKVFNPTIVENIESTRKKDYFDDIVGPKYQIGAKIVNIDKGHKTRSRGLKYYIHE